MREIAKALPYQLGVGDYVLEQEALYTWVPDPAGGAELNEAVDLSSLMHDGLVHVWQLEHPEEEEATFADLAVLIDGGEAIAGALAFHRSYSVATDDHKVHRVLQEHAPRVSLFSTLELPKIWAEETSVPDAELQAAMMSMRSLASYVPRTGDPLYVWWQETMHGSSS